MKSFTSCRKPREMLGSFHKGWDSIPESSRPTVIVLAGGEEEEEGGEEGGTVEGVVWDAEGEWADAGWRTTEAKVKRWGMVRVKQ